MGGVDELNGRIEEEEEIQQSNDPSKILFDHSYQRGDVTGGDMPRFCFSLPDEKWRKDALNGLKLSKSPTRFATYRTHSFVRPQ
ncbi:hypothetical protein PFISCL1PPCAC_18001 [Pristionchus fissidentatus]|uniref:Uncharacterized protein n=1 Tax=Pristionchus fissidentatus TaxID=1538716 RepID=A0AAV5W452_9BILA|nr:hypothetical protein PFISCL1PPCAC_18001 [Pristionchus fissidentatus]